MTSPQLLTPGGLPVPGLTEEPNIPLDFAEIGEALDARIEARFTTTSERDGTWGPLVAPLGARCFITGTGKRYERWGSVTGNQWFELHDGALVVGTPADRDNLTPRVPGLRARTADHGRTWEWSGTFWRLLNDFPRSKLVRFGATTIPTGTWTDVPFGEVGGVMWDTWGGFVTPYYVAPIDGLYTVYGVVCFVAHADLNVRAVRMTRAPASAPTTFNSIYGCASTAFNGGTEAIAVDLQIPLPTVDVELEAGDRVKMQVYQGSGVSLDLRGVTYSTTHNTSWGIRMIEST